MKTLFIPLVSILIIFNSVCSVADDKTDSVKISDLRRQDLDTAGQEFESVLKEWSDFKSKESDLNRQVQVKQEKLKSLLKQWVVDQNGKSIPDDQLDELLEKRFWNEPSIKLIVRDE